MNQKLRRFSIRLCVLLVAYVAVLILAQDIMLFPGAVDALWRMSELRAPSAVDSFFVSTSDGEKINVWHLAADKPKKRIAIFFHGNGGNMKNFFSYQTWLASLGISSYSFDYRGYGNSSGWPSSSGILLDAEAVIQEIKLRENFPESKIIYVGVSLGTGPAAELAAKYNAKTLVVLAPYSELKKRASEEPIAGYLTFFLRHNFDTVQAIQRLTNACIAIVHGENDRVICPEHSRQIIAQAPPQVHVASRFLPGVGHNDLLENGAAALDAALQECLAFDAQDVPRE